jgi:hypothetical protein
VTDDLSQLVQSEQAKRERNWNPARRWQVIQNTLTWGEQQRTVLRNTPAACLANQNRLLAAFAKAAAKKA